MSADTASLGKFGHRSLRLHVLLTAAVVLATLLAGLLVSATLQLLRQEQERIEFHFQRLTAAIVEQEDFIRRWRVQDRSLMPATGTQGTSLAGPSQGYQPFSVITVDGAEPPPGVWMLGTRLATFYGAFWGDSNVPSPRCVLVNGAGSAGLVVPLTANDLEITPSTVMRGQPLLAEVRAAVAANEGQRRAIVWLPQGAVRNDRRVLSVAKAPLDTGAWQDVGGLPAPAIGCFLDIDRLDDHRQLLGADIYDDLTLLGPGGELLYGPAPDTGSDRARQFTRAGVIYRMRAASGMRAQYLVAWPRILSQPRGPLITGVLLAMLLTTAGVLLLRDYRRSVLLPMRAQHEQLLESEAFSRTILDAAPIGLCLLRADDGATILDNSVARQWLGESPQAEGWHGEWRQRALTSTLARAEVMNIPYTTPDDRHLLVAATPARFRGEAAVLCLFIDLSAQYHAGQAVEQARLAAEQANQTKSLFLATMSHEIRTPLYGVLGTLELLDLTSLDARQHAYVETIHQASSSLMSLISDILDVSKAEAGQLTLEPVSFSPVELTEQVLRSYAGAAMRKQLQLYGCIEGDIVALAVGDSTRIRQVLNNLVSNAIKFTDAGRVVIRLRAAPDNPLRVEWQVADTGIGIDAEHQPRLFDPFFQANPGKEGARGTGLGLAISAQLAALMDGELNVVSEPGLGSSFTLSLPVGRSPLPAPEPPALGLSLSVLVRSPSRELALNMVERLRRRGVDAQLWGVDASAQVPASAILLELPLNQELQEWDGLRLVASPDGSGRVEDVGDHWEVTLYDLDAIVAALLHCAGQPEELQPRSGVVPLTPLGLRVLVAEDNPINQMILRQQLETLGCQAVVAADGQEALGYWTRQAFDVVITDINMPHLNGYGLTRKLRELGTRVPIIGASANVEVEEGERCIASGMDRYLTKPISLTALRDALETLADPVHEMSVPAHLSALFLNTMRGDLDGLRAAVDRVNPVEVEQRLHSIRGALVMVFAGRLVAQAEMIENSLAAGASLEACATTIRAFISHLDQALTRLEQLPPEAPGLH